MFFIAFSWFPSVFGHLWPWLQAAAPQFVPAIGLLAVRRQVARVGGQVRRVRGDEIEVLPQGLAPRPGASRKAHLQGGLVPKIAVPQVDVHLPPRWSRQLLALSLECFERPAAQRHAHLLRLTTSST